MYIHTPTDLKLISYCRHNPKQIHSNHDGNSVFKNYYLNYFELYPLSSSSVKKLNICVCGWLFFFLWCFLTALLTYCFSLFRGFRRFARILWTKFRLNNQFNIIYLYLQNKHPFIWRLCVFECWKQSKNKKERTEKY